MYKNYIFDLYGTLIDINTDEWSIDIWEKMAIYYGYKGAHYTAEELNEEYGRGKGIFACERCAVKVERK